MKRIISILALVLAMTMVMSISAFATPAFSLAEDAVVPTGATVTPAADSIAVALTGATNGADYSILLVAGDTLPTVDSDIAYINQKTATIADGEETASVSFDVLPLLTSCTEEMKLYIGTNATGENLISIPVTYAEPAPANDYITSADIDKATITAARYTFAKGTDPYAKATVELDAEKYPNITNGTGVYVLKMVDANGDVVEDAEVFYSPERKLYVAVYASSVTDYKFEVLTEGTANETFVYGNVNLDANNAINITDKMQIVNYIKDNSKIITTLKKSAAADVNGDGRVNITDKMQIVNLIKARATDPDAKLNIVK